MVREILRELTDEVPNYADPDGILAAGRAVRRRTVLRVAALGALGAAAGTELVRRTTVTPHPVGRPGPEPMPSYPPEIIPPDDPPPLPAGPVGPALLVYRKRCAGRCDTATIIVLADGTQYNIDHVGDLGVPSLSPDGRWLVAAFDRGEYVLRDLDSRALVVVPVIVPVDADLSPGEWQPMTWSSDGRWLLFWGPLGNDTYQYARVDPTAPHVVTYQAPPGRHTVAILPDGRLLTERTPWSDPDHPSLSAVDPETGVESPLPSGAGFVPAAGQSVRNDGVDAASVSADGSRIARTIRAGNRAVGVLELALRTGRVLRQVELPPDGDWTPVAYVGSRLMLVNRLPLKIGFLGPDGPRITEATRLPNPVALLVRGGRTWY
jgi:hypothetical protein